MMNGARTQVLPQGVGRFVAKVRIQLFISTNKCVGSSSARSILLKHLPILPH
jgi:hypothetical protein